MCGTHCARYGMEPQSLVDAAAAAVVATAATATATAAAATCWLLPGDTEPFTVDRAAVNAVHARGLGWLSHSKRRMYTRIRRSVVA